MNFDEKENDPFLLNLLLINLSEICFFPKDAEIAEDCVNVGIIYSNEAWKNSVHPYAKCSFSSTIMKENQQISCYLQKFAEPFEMETYLFRQFSLSQIKKLGNGQWRKIPLVIKSNIRKLAENSRKKIITSIIPTYAIYPQCHFAHTYKNRLHNLLTNFPSLSIFDDNPWARDLSTHVLYSGYDEILFGVGHRSSENIVSTINTKNTSPQHNVESSSFEIKFPFFNEDKLCIYSAFINMCALTLKSETTEEFSKSLSISTENPLRVCINLLKKDKADI